MVNYLSVWTQPDTFPQTVAHERPLCAFNWRGGQCFTTFLESNEPVLPGEAVRPAARGLKHAAGPHAFRLSPVAGFPTNAGVTSALILCFILPGGLLPSDWLFSLFPSARQFKMHMHRRSNAHQICDYNLVFNPDLNLCVETKRSIKRRRRVGGRSRPRRLCFCLRRP